MRRVEEEMRKRERLEAERKEREAEQAEADRLALEESERLVKIYFMLCIFYNEPTILSKHMFSVHLFKHILILKLNRKINGQLNILFPN